jgi:intracellular septation protein
MKPTIVYLIFAAILGFGMIVGRPFLKLLLEEAFELSPEGWRILTWRWVGFFVFLALLNELVWRNFPTDMWIKLKVFGFLPLTMLFAMAQIGLVQKYGAGEDAGKGD